MKHYQDDPNFIGPRLPEDHPAYLAQCVNNPTDTSTSASPPTDHHPADPAADELLAPAPTEFAHAPRDDALVQPPAPLTFDAALMNGTIPQFELQPSETAVGLPAAPLDVAAERAAYEQLLAFIRQHADPGTQVSALDPDQFTDGL